MVDIYSLEAIPPQSTIFDDLQIDMNHKLIIQSLVAAHFEKQRIYRQQPILRPIDQYLVRGKGSGLFILLHGVPCVGKTATAEAVAQANKKPLFSITCGDLGLTPEAVDSKLNELFRLAHFWDCVLLLDEADIFLTRGLLLARQTLNLFEKVAVAIEKFRNYMDYTRAVIDADQARLEMVLADHMRNDYLAPRRSEQDRRREQAPYQYRSPSTYGDGPPREPMAGDGRRRAKYQMPSSRPTRQRDGSLAGRLEAPARNPRAYTQAGIQGGPSMSGRTPAGSKRHEQRSRYDPGDEYGEEDEYMGEREFRVSDKISRNTASINDFENGDYNDDEGLLDREVRKGFIGGDELDYDE
ncbi:hypothetical protein EDB82DRAFT_478896 [Fusarium venenatum]|uniref:uncharacterized protein n=1 Tax=Fusarium venenatum TaxID=56646 RepID=UPI001D20ADA7|nr:hypothetical protein EDB82DRAFT_478896 [Fusarium venenatum]